MGCGSSTTNHADSAPVEKIDVDVSTAKLPVDVASVKDVLSRTNPESAHFLLQVMWYCTHKRDFGRLLKEMSPHGELEAIAFDAPRKDYRQKKRDRAAGTATTIDELYEVAALVDPLFKQAMEAIAAAVGGGVNAKFPPGGLKGKDRAAQKARNDYGDVVGMLFDIVRMTFDCAAGTEVAAIVAAIKASPHVVHTIKGKNRCKNPTANGFFDIMMQVLFQFELGGGVTVEHVCEVQIHIRAATAYAHDNNSHGVYEFFREYFAGSDETVRARMGDITAILGGGGGGSEFGIPFLDAVDVASVEPAALFESLVVDVMQSGDVGRLDAAGDLFREYTLEYELAAVMYEKALEIGLKALGPEHEDVGFAYNNLALVLKNQGEHEKATVMYEKALAIYLKALGPEHAAVGQTYNNLAIVLENQGEYEKAKAMYEKALAIQLKALGPEHESVGQTYNNLAAVLQTQGEYEKAKAMYEKALAIKVKALGPEHASVGNSYNNLALVLEKQGEYEKAKAMYEKALAIYLKALGPEHASVGQTYNNLANVLQNQGEYEKAKAMFEKALAIQLKALGPEHADVGDTYYNLAIVLDNLGEYEKAMAMFSRVVDCYTQAYGKDHAETVDAAKQVEAMRAKL